MNPSSSADLLVGRLIAEVEDLTAAVRELIELTPTRNRTWLPPRDFARIVGCSTRSLGNWRTQGRFRDCSIRKNGAGWEFHSINAVADLDGER